MTHPYLGLIEAEAKRSEDDLTGFRTRALAVVTTSAGVVTLLTGAVTFAASKSEEDAGLPDAAIWAISVSLVLFLVAAGFALLVNSPRDVDRPGGAELLRISSDGGWPQLGADGNGVSDTERDVANVLAKYVVSLRAVADSSAKWLATAIKLQVAGLIAAAASAVLVMMLTNG